MMKGRDEKIQSFRRKSPTKILALMLSPTHLLPASANRRTTLHEFFKIGRLFFMRQPKHGAQAFQINIFCTNIVMSRHNKLLYFGQHYSRRFF